jgi:hydrogenase maturation protease
VSSVLIAGIGNVFKGDDGFGVEVARRLAGQTLPAGIEVADFGIRGIDLTYALLDRCDRAILIDALSRGEPPGTLFVVEPEASRGPGPGQDPTGDPTGHPAQEPTGCAPEWVLLSPHELAPDRVLAAVRALDGRCRRILVLGCEPETFGDDWEGLMGLSPAVAAAVPEAAALAEALALSLLAEEAAAPIEPSKDPPPPDPHRPYPIGDPG